MLRRFFQFISVATLAVLSLGLTVPPLSGPVVDTANLIPPAERQLLTEHLRSLWNSGGSQVAVLTVPTLDGETIEQASIEVVEAWQLGSAKADNGVLLMVARDERTLRIEVGQGLEGVLTDAYSRRIVDNVITPYFRAGNFGGGIIAGVNAILSYTDPNAATIGSGRVTQSRNLGMPRRPSIANYFFIFILLSIFFFGGRRRRRGFFWSGGGFGGGGFGGGGFGGGGFGGGGGGFSGGGASGRW